MLKVANVSWTRNERAHVEQNQAAEQPRPPPPKKKTARRTDTPANWPEGWVTGANKDQPVVTSPQEEQKRLGTSDLLAVRHFCVLEQTQTSCPPNPASVCLTRTRDQTFENLHFWKKFVNDIQSSHPDAIQPRSKDQLFLLQLLNKIQNPTCDSVQQTRASLSLSKALSTRPLVHTELPTSRGSSPAPLTEPHSRASPPHNTVFPRATQRVITTKCAVSERPAE